MCARDVPILRQVARQPIIGCKEGQRLVANCELEHASWEVTCELVVRICKGFKRSWQYEVLGDASSEAVVMQRQGKDIFAIIVNGLVDEIIVCFNLGGMVLRAVELESFNSSSKPVIMKEQIVDTGPPSYRGERPRQAVFRDIKKNQP